MTFGPALLKQNQTIQIFLMNPLNLYIERKNRNMTQPTLYNTSGQHFIFHLSLFSSLSYLYKIQYFNPTPSPHAHPSSITRIRVPIRIINIVLITSSIWIQILIRVIVQEVCHLIIVFRILFVLRVRELPSPFRWWWLCSSTILWS